MWPLRLERGDRLAPSPRCSRRRSRAASPRAVRGRAPRRPRGTPRCSARCTRAAARRPCCDSSDRAVVDVGEVHDVVHVEACLVAAARGAARRRRRRCGSCRCGRARRRSGRRCTCGRCCRATARSPLRGGSACCRGASERAGLNVAVRPAASATVCRRADGLAHFGGLAGAAGLDRPARPSTWRNSKAMSCACRPPPLPQLRRQPGRPSRRATARPASAVAEVLRDLGGQLLRDRRADRRPPAPTGAGPASTRPASPVDSDIAQILQRNAAEQPARAAAVGLDLRAQRVDVGERALVAQPLHERQPQRLIVEVAIESRRRASRSPAARRRRTSAASRCWSSTAWTMLVDGHASWRRRRPAAAARCRSAGWRSEIRCSRPRPAPRATTPSMK